MSSILSCGLCEAGDTAHAHALGVRAKCADCHREGVVVATNQDDYDQSLAKGMLELEASCYGDAPSVTCFGCESLRFKAALPRRGRCPACGDTDPDRVKLSSTQAFCDDNCRTDFANGKRWKP